jgi:pyruvate/2-oxoglutarate dehydrogenase complex dihydrolipoamide dehydrogenase (E3) component
MCLVRRLPAPENGGGLEGDATGELRRLYYRRRQCRFRRHRAGVEEDTDRVLGAHFVGHAGEELINLFGPAMQHGIPGSQIRDFVFAYPTFSADIKSML